MNSSEVIPLQCSRAAWLSLIIWSLSVEDQNNKADKKLHPTDNAGAKSELLFTQMKMWFNSQRTAATKKKNLYPFWITVQSRDLTWWDFLKMRVYSRKCCIFLAVNGCTRSEGNLVPFHFKGSFLDVCLQSYSVKHKSPTGSILRRTLLPCCGLSVDWTRAGADSELGWLGLVTEDFSVSDNRKRPPGFFFFFQGRPC